VLVAACAGSVTLWLQRRREWERVLATVVVAPLAELAAVLAPLDGDPRADVRRLARKVLREASRREKWSQ
jgi:hypothetical protein